MKELSRTVIPHFHTFETQLVALPVVPLEASERIYEKVIPPISQRHSVKQVDPSGKYLSPPSCLLWLVVVSLVPMVNPRPVTSPFT